MTALERNRGEILPPPHEYASAHEKLAAGFAQDFSRDPADSIAQIIGEVTAGRLEKLAAGFDESTKERFLSALPPVSELGAEGLSAGGFGRGVVFGKSELQVSLPGLKVFNPIWRAKIMYEYLRFYLLRETANQFKGATKSGLGREEIYSSLADLTKTDVAISDSGKYVAHYTSGTTFEKPAQVPVMEADSELFIDVLVAMAARATGTRHNLLQIWHQMFTREVSFATTKEVGNFLLTDDESPIGDQPVVDGLPYRYNHKENDIKVARERLATEATLKTKAVMDRTRKSRVQAASASGQGYDSALLAHLEAEESGFRQKGELLRVLIKGSLERIDHFEKKINDVDEKNAKELVAVVKDVFFVELGQMFRQGLEGGMFLKDSDPKQPKPTPVEFIRLQSRLEFAMTVIKGLSFKINQVEQAKGQREAVAAAKVLKEAALNALVDLRDNFSQVDGSASVKAKK